MSPSASSTSPWQEPVRGAHPDPSLLGLSGIEQLRLFFTDRGPPPPITHLMGMLPTEIGSGSAVFAMPATEWLLAPQNVISTGVLCALADGPLGCAVQTALPAGTLYTTSELSLRVLSPARAGGMLTARGSLVQARRTIALSEVFVQDERGRLLAHGSSLCFLIPLKHVPPPPEDLPRIEQPAYDTPDPYQRPALGEVVGQEVWERMSGLEVLQAQIAGELPEPPIHHLTGLRPTAAGEGSASFAMPATGWLAAPPPGRVQGGCVALIADAAAASAIQTLLPAGTSYAPVDIKVNFLRPAQTDGRELLATARVLHPGRSIMVADAEVTDADGRLLAVTRSSAIVREGRAASLA